MTIRLVVFAWGRQQSQTNRQTDRRNKGELNITSLAEIMLLSIHASCVLQHCPTPPVKQAARMC